MPRTHYSDQNPGLARRFNASMPVRFEDFTDTELASILSAECRKLDLVAPLPVKRHAIKKLAKLRALPNFGNAGAVQTMLADAKARMAVRLQVLGACWQGTLKPLSVSPVNLSPGDLSIDPLELRSTYPLPCCAWSSIGSRPCVGSRPGQATTGSGRL